MFSWTEYVIVILSYPSSRLFTFNVDINAVSIAFQKCCRSTRLLPSSTMFLRLLLYFDQWLYFLVDKMGYLSLSECSCYVPPMFLVEFNLSA